ncbi:MAG: MarR family winged helix-turn-helix transcriptional regulator [Fidelibacterota bacterium]
MDKTTPLSKYTAEERRALSAWVKLSRAAESVGSRLREENALQSLTPPQFGVLEMLYHLGPLCQKEIGAKLLRSGGNITLVVDNLEKQGLVQRRKHPRDRRYYRICLTKEGTKLIEKAFQFHLRLLVSLFSVLTSSEQETLSTLCRKLGYGVTNKDLKRDNIEIKS